LRCHFVFMSASAGYPRFFKASSTPSISRSWILHLSKRKQFAALFDDAAKQKFDCVLFWALDRFSREGMAQTIIHLQRLSSYGAAFHSYTEPHLATDNELVRNILLALLSSLAKVEARAPLIQFRHPFGRRLDCRERGRSECPGLYRPFQAQV
jgi:DNA invertase Pin-like site-specific DNA recombinase